MGGWVWVGGKNEKNNSYFLSQFRTHGKRQKEDEDSSESNDENEGSDDISINLLCLPAELIEHICSFLGKIYSLMVSCVFLFEQHPPVVT